MNYPPSFEQEVAVNVVHNMVSTGSTSVMLTVPVTSAGRLVSGVTDAQLGQVACWRSGSSASAQESLVALDTGTLGTYTADQQNGTGSWVETNVEGLYQLCLPNAWFAGGAGSVAIVVTHQGIEDTLVIVDLI